MNAHDPNLAKPLPVNLDLEQGVLGALLMQADTPGSVVGVLRAEHFSEPLHQRIYEVCLEMLAAGRRPTPITIKDFLPADLQVGNYSMNEYLAHLAASALPNTLVAYSKGIIDLAVRRDLIGIGEDIQAVALDASPGEAPKQQIEAAIERLSRLAASGLRRDQRQSTAGFAADAMVQSIESEEKLDPPISSGLSALDRIIGGYRRGNLLILAGRPGMGKSMLAGSSALRATEAGHGVLFFSKEMTKEQLVARLLTDLAYTTTLPLTYEAVLNRSVPADRRHLLREAATRLRDLPFIIDPQPGMTMAEIATRARRVAESMARKGVTLGLTIVDHLGKVKAAGNGDNRALELGEMTNAGSDLAKEVNACVVMLCQLNRQVEGRENKRPMLSDLRESGRIEEDADCVVALYREAYYLSKRSEDDPEKEIARTEKLARVAHDLEAIVMKNRHGSEGVAKLWVHPGTASVRDREWRS